MRLKTLLIVVITVVVFVPYCMGDSFLNSTKVNEGLKEQVGRSGTFKTFHFENDLNPTNGQVPTWNTGDTVTWEDGGGGAVEGTAVLSTGETVGFVLQADGDNTSSWVELVGGGNALTSNPLSQFATTTSSQLLGVLSDETGTGLSVFATSPTFTTSIIMGAANLNEAELEILDGATLDTTELNFVDGVTSAIQTQLNAKQATVTDGNALTFTGATLDFDGGATPSGDLGGTWATPTVTSVQVNSVALGTDTTGNYAATIADAGNSTITVANSGTETAAITLDLTANGVDDTHIDFGTGANQVSLDDIPEGTTRYYINNAFNGTFKEEFDATVTSNGTTVTMSIQATDGGDLTEQFSSGLTTFDTTPAVTIALTAGTDSSPQNNWIYILQSAPGTLVKSTSTWPSVEHIRVAFIVVQSAVSVQSASGAMINQNWNNSLTSNADSMGEATHIAERMRINSARYFSGVDGNGTDNYLTPTAGNVEFISTSGIVYQVHAHAFPVINTSTGSELHVKNWSGDAFHALTNLYDIVDDSTGTTITNNKFFNLVFWGVANKGGEHQTVMINVPGGVYNTQSGAEGDGLGFDDFEMPREFTLDSSTGFLIARMTIQMKTGGGTWVIASTVDLRKSNPQQANGGASSLVTSFADNTFDIFDNTDNTKLMVFDVGASITTGTTRTYTAPDADGTLALTSQSDGTINITDITSFTKAQLETQTSDVSDYAEADGDVFTGVHDFGGATSLTIPQGATPTVDAAGKVAVDTTITSHNGMLIYHDGTTAMTIPAIPTADLTTIDGHVIDYNAAGNKFTMDSPAAGGETNSLEVVTTGIATTEIPIGTGVNTAVYAALSGDATMDNAGVVTVIAASKTLSGILELATTAEINLGTDTVRAMPIDQFEDSDFANPGVSLLINQTTVLTTGDGKMYLRVPDHLAGWTMTNATAARVAGSDDIKIQIFNDTQGTDTLSTALWIDAGETDSSTAGTSSVFNAAEDDFTLADRLRIDVDIAGTDTTWLEIQIECKRTAP